jgi:hypothetical protein
MIVAPTRCFFVLNLVEDAATSASAFFSEGASGDITSVSLVSKDFESDIDAVHKLDTSIAAVRDSVHTSGNIEINDAFNPLYLPHSMGDIDDLLSLDLRTDNFNFTGFSGSPYVIRIVQVLNDEMPLMDARLQYHPFELPNYTELVAKQENTSVN